MPEKLCYILTRHRFRWEAARYEDTRFCLCRCCGKLLKIPK